MIETTETSQINHDFLPKTPDSRRGWGRFKGGLLVGASMILSWILSCNPSAESVQHLVITGRCLTGTMTFLDQELKNPVEITFDATNIRVPDNHGVQVVITDPSGFSLAAINEVSPIRTIKVLEGGLVGLGEGEESLVFRPGLRYQVAVTQISFDSSPPREVRKLASGEFAIKCG